MIVSFVDFPVVHGADRHWTNSTLSGIHYLEKWQRIRYILSKVRRYRILLILFWEYTQEYKKIPQYIFGLGVRRRFVGHFINWSKHNFTIRNRANIWCHSGKIFKLKLIKL